MVRKVDRLGRFLALVKELVERNSHDVCQLFKSLDGRYGVTVLGAREVAAKQARAPLNVSLDHDAFRGSY
jgi:hypothetical protein